MSEFELILDECLTQLVNGASSLDEILARHPEHASQLKPLLQTAMRFRVADELKPAPVFQARARAQLTNYMKSHPRRQSWMMMPIWRVALSAAILVIALLLTGTAFAQSALPGQTLYAWKLSSENIWRATAPNPVVVDLSLADRRVGEMIAVAPNSMEEAQALSGYLDTLSRLQSEMDSQNSTQIMQLLKIQQSELSQSGISVPQLDQIVLPAPSTSPLPINTPVLPNLAPTIVPTSLPPVLPNIIPTVKLPPLVP
jgi:hypothetical protein